MDNNKLKSLIGKKPDCFVQIIKSHHKDFYDKIDRRYVGTKFSEKIYIHLYGEVTCGSCDEKPKFISFNKGYNKYCSRKCSNLSNSDKIQFKRKLTLRCDKYEKKSCLKCNSIFESLISRKQKFCSVKCSTSYTANDVNRINKIKETKLQKYGDENFVNKEKSKQTNLRRYGVENVFANKDIQNQIKSTNLKKYGSEYFFASEEGKDKIKKSNIRKYGVQNPSMCDQVKERVKNTVRQKYGVNNVFSSSEVKDKIKTTNLDRYGVEFPSQNDEINSKIRDTMKIHNYKSIISRLTELTDIIPLFDVDDFDDTKRINKYKFKCNLCNDVFYDHIDDGHLPRCLSCNPIFVGKSKCEINLYQYIRDITNAEIIQNDRTILNGKELDIYIPEKKIAIEFNGIYWHSELSGGKSKNYHIEKTKECNKKDIRLIHIFEDEWVHKNKLLKCKLTHILNENNDKSVYARKCDIRVIDNCEEFNVKYHIQGNCPSKIKIGAFYNENLVAVMTFGNLRSSLGNRDIDVSCYELLRFSTSCKVVGISSKLFKFFVDNYKPSKVITYADRRYSVGNLYNMLNFRLVGETPPNYWYFKLGEYTRYHRYTFAKHTLKNKFERFDVNLTEWQNMQMNGYDRIWDCGNYKFEWECEK